MRLDKQRQRSCIWCYYQLAAEPAFQRQLGNTEGPVLVRVGSITNIVGRLRYAPRHTPLRPVRNVPSHGPLMGLAE